MDDCDCLDITESKDTNVNPKLKNIIRSNNLGLFQ